MTKEQEREAASDLQLGTRSRLRAFVLLGLTLAGLLICFWLLLPFLPALVWALALAILFLPAHRLVEARFGNPNAAAALSVLMIGLLVVVPVLLLSGMVIQGATEGAMAARDKIVSGQWRQAIEMNEFLAPVARWLSQLDLSGTLENIANWLASISASFVSGSVLGIIIAIVGGLLLFGASGLLLGPLVLTVTMFFLEIWRVPVGGSNSE